MEKEVTNNEILEAINAFSTTIDGKMSNLESKVSNLESKVSNLESNISAIKSDIGWIKSNMVTKDFLDDKLADLRGDLVVLVRKEDNKLLKLVDILKEHKLISVEEATAVLTMEPFAKLSL